MDRLSTSVPACRIGHRAGCAGWPRASCRVADAGYVPQSANDHFGLYEFPAQEQPKRAAR
eukprot:5188659-Prymnesium_polylepis.1